MKQTVMSKPTRLASLDVLRGFDMFFITGGAGLVCGICAALGMDGSWLFMQMKHVPWEGFHHHDTIFPLFLFLAGASFPFSLASQQAKGYSTARIYLRILKRAVVLFALGLSLGGILRFDPGFRLSSVLGFIGLSWGLAAALFTAVKTDWRRWVIFAAVVLGYFALLHFAISPEAPAMADGYSKEWNIIRWFDVKAFPNHLYRSVAKCAGGGIPYDPESLMSLPGGIATAMLGMFAGVLLRSSSAPAVKALRLVGFGGGCLAAFAIFRFLIGVPLVKALWTVSFVFAAATYAFWMLALFYYLVDVRGWRRWTVAFDPVGKNSILVYMMMSVGVTELIRDYLFHGICKAAGNWGWALESLTLYLVSWTILRFCQRKGVFLKV